MIEYFRKLNIFENSVLGQTKDVEGRRPFGPRRTWSVRVDAESKIFGRSVVRPDGHRHRRRCWTDRRHDWSQSQ